MSVLIAVDKFKGSLTQSQITTTISKFLTAQGIAHESISIADGGDGSIDALVALGWQRESINVVGPLDNAHQAEYAVSPDKQRVALELAELCGIKYLNGVLKPFAASSSALGQAIRLINPRQFKELLICVGGSASVDGGAGILQGLGIKITDAASRDVEPGLRGLLRTVAIDVAALERIKREVFGECEITVLSDTNLPLLGRSGAVASFGRQKGLSFTQLFIAEFGMRRWFALARRLNYRVNKVEPGTGSAGGVGFALHAFFGAKIRSGSSFFIEESRAQSKLGVADILITGEGRIDDTTLSGKTIFPLLILAKSLHKKVILVCGSAVDSTLRRLKKDYPIIEIVKLSDSGKPLQELLNDAENILTNQLKSSHHERWSV